MVSWVEREVFRDQLARVRETMAKRWLACLRIAYCSLLPPFGVEGGQQ